MSGRSVRQELILFAIAAGQGGILHILYDFLRSWRRVLPPGRRTLAATDFLYWIFCGLLLFYPVLGMEQGLLRGYQILGIFAGAFLWNRLLSEIFVKICSYILSYPVFFMNFLRKRLIFFLRRCRILGYQFFKWVLKGKKSV